MIDILKCPFCGVEDEADFTRSAFGKVYVKCLVCGAQGPHHYKTEDAIGAWNDVSILSTLKKDVSKNSEKIDTMRFELVKATIPIAAKVAFKARCNPGDFEIGIAFGAIRIADEVIKQLSGNSGTLGES